MTYIIAEAAQGHEGKPIYAEHLIRAAKKAGADAVKFQLVVADDLALPDYSYYPWYKKVEFGASLWKQVSDIASSAGIDLILDVFGQNGIAIAKSLKLAGLKLHAADFFDDGLVEAAYDVAPRVYLSTGGILPDELHQRVGQLSQRGLTDRTVLLYGYQAEPTPIEHSNVGRIAALCRLFPRFGVGYMDHTDGGGPDFSIVSAMAIAAGATFLEKHLTVDRFLEFDSFVSALAPAEFNTYVQQIRRLDAAWGPSDLDVGSEEMAYRRKYVKKLILAKAADAGDEVTRSMLIFKRTGSISEAEGFQNPADVVGRKLSVPLLAGQPLVEEYFE